MVLPAILVQRAFFILSCVSSSTVYCSEDQLFISLVVCCLGLVFLIGVLVELSSRPFYNGGRNQAIAMCRSPLATHPMLILFCISLAGIVLLFHPFATPFRPEPWDTTAAVVLSSHMPPPVPSNQRSSRVPLDQAQYLKGQQV